jgi:hypothetical protein
MLTSQELRLRTLLRVLSLIFGLAVFGYLLPALVGPERRVAGPGNAWSGSSDC